MSGRIGGDVKIFCDGHHVVKRIHFIQFASVDDAHKDVGDASSVFGFEKQCVFSMQDCFFHRAFADIIMCAVQRRILSSGWKSRPVNCRSDWKYLERLRRFYEQAPLR